MAHRQPAVQIVDLVKRYGRGDATVTAVAGLRLDILRGEVFALLGPNGAGKTTTLEMIEGLTTPTSGRAQVLGLDVQRERSKVIQRIGVQLQASSYFEHLTLEEILRLFGSFYRRRRSPGELLDMVGLADRRRALVGQLSGGQAQRFSIVAALVNDPDVVFLDEPTTGLDPQARRNLWDLVSAINAQGTTVVLTTHYMEEAEVLADRVGIMSAGRLVALDTPERLIDATTGSHRLAFTLSAAAEERDLAAVPGVTAVTAHHNGRHRYDLSVAATEVAVPALFEWATQRSLRIDDLQVSRPTLEDVFLSRTGTALRA